MAVSQSGLDGKAVDAALTIIRDGGSAPEARREIEALSADLDDAYLRLWTQHEPAARMEALLLFRKARAAAALAVALSGDCEQLQEALYEAAHAVDDQGEALRSFETAFF
jgi:hypothetical protein